MRSIKRRKKLIVRLIAYRREIAPHAALKVVRKTSVIKIDRTDYGVFAIRYKQLFMNKASVFVDGYAAFYKIRIRGARHYPNETLIGNAGRNDTHVYAALCGIAKSLGEIVVDDKVWRSYIDVPLGLIYNV